VTCGTSAADDGTDRGHGHGAAGRPRPRVGGARVASASRPGATPSSGAPAPKNSERCDVRGSAPATRRWWRSASPTCRRRTRPRARTPRLDREADGRRARRCGSCVGLRGQLWRLAGTRSVARASGRQRSLFGRMKPGDRLGEQSAGGTVARGCASGPPHSRPAGVEFRRSGQRNRGTPRSRVGRAGLSLGARGRAFDLGAQLLQRAPPATPDVERRVGRRQLR
jgi:hypothetical protein